MRAAIYARFSSELQSSSSIEDQFRLCEEKARAAGLRDSSFAAEWLAVSIVVAAVALAYRAAMMITLVDLPGFGLTIFELIMTVLFYPVAVAITHFLLGVQKVAPGDREIGGGPA